MDLGPIRRRLTIALIASVLVFVVLVSCTFTPIDPPPFTVCSPITPAISWKDASQPRLLYVIVEGNPAYQTDVKSSFTVLSHILPQISEPGDRLIMAWMEQDTLDKAVFIDVAANPISTPAFPPFPSTQEPTFTPVITSTPAITPTMPQSTIGRLAATKNAAGTQAAMEATTTWTMNEYYCSVDEALHAWEKLRQDSKDDFATRVNDQMTQVPAGSHESQSNIFEALRLAAKTLKQECSIEKYHGDCNLVIIVFSDMQDFRQNLPNLQPQDIDLANMDVFVVLWKCKFTYDNTPLCAQKVNAWSTPLAAYHATSEFISNQNVEVQLATSMKR